MFLKISQNSQEKSCAREFSNEFCERRQCDLGYYKNKRVCYTLGSQSSVPPQGQVSIFRYALVLTHPNLSTNTHLMSVPYFSYFKKFVHLSR